MSIFIQNSSDDQITETFKGAVLCTREYNGYDDSDFYAVVWDESVKGLRSIEYATTRAWTYNNHANADATPEVIQKAQEWMAEWSIKALTRSYTNASTKIEVGKQVRVISGKKVPIGTEGKLLRIDNFRHYIKVCIETPEGRVWTYLKNLEVVNPEQYIPSQEEIRKIAENNKNRFHLPFARGIVLG